MQPDCVLNVSAPRAARTLPLVLFLARGAHVGVRAVTNEKEVIDFIGKRYEAEVRRVEFPHMSPWETIELMCDADVVVGMHGGQFANVIWLRPGAQAVQARFLLEEVPHAACLLYTCKTHLQLHASWHCYPCVKQVLVCCADVALGV